MARRERAIVFVLVASASGAACGWDPSRPFDRNAPLVEEAIQHLDAGRADAAASTLEQYLGTGPCSEGSIGTPIVLGKRPQGTFDLGLALFDVGEAFGRRFGEEERGEGEGDPQLAAQRKAHVDCAHRILGVVAANADNPTELRAKAYYLEGNLSFLAGAYEDAVKAYDQALGLEPGHVDGGVAVGRDAAWNRAIALLRIEEKKQKDGGPPDGGNEPQPDGSQPSDGGPNDSRPDAGPPNTPPDGGQDKDDAGAPPPSEPDGGTPPDESDAGREPPAPPPRANADDRILDQLENAPTVQQEAARKQAGKRRVRGMADK